MENRISTTIEQSKELVRLGLDPKTADMVWMFNKWLYSIKDNILNREQFSEQDTLAWSLSALLEVMPKPDLYRETADLWVCVAYFKEGTIRGFGETAIDAAYEMVCWLLENNLIKRGGQDGRD